MSVIKVINRVAPEASLACQRTYGVSPALDIEGDKDITCSYIPTHLEYIIFELLKNAMRAVCESHLISTGFVMFSKKKNENAMRAVCEGHLMSTWFVFKITKKSKKNSIRHACRVRKPSHVDRYFC